MLTTEDLAIETRYNGMLYDLHRSDSGRFIITPCGEHPNNIAVVAMKNNKLIGLVQGELDDDVYRDRFTFVTPAWRRRGVGLTLWKTLLAAGRPKVVRAYVISDKGWTLIHSVKELFPTIDFVIYDDAERQSRDLRKSRRG